jgi:predicted amidophosphoribosyltransferase
LSLQHGDSDAWWKPGPRAKAIARTALDLIFPPQALDDTAAPLSTGFSAEGWSRIGFIDGPLCDGCGQPFEYDLGPGVRCPDCTAKPRAFSRARAACLYDDNSRGVILQFKHGDRSDLAPMVARWISRAARDLLEDAAAIAPVLLHPGRLFGRRFNQVAEIARPLSRLSGVANLPDALVRTRATET